MERDGDLSCETPDGFIVQGDLDSLIRLFANLVDNAIKYTMQGSVSISAQPQPDASVRIDISDTGVGMPAEDLPHIFERFYRVEKSCTSNGAGLGPAIVQEIVRAHGGKIEVASVVGQRTTVSVWLPQDA